MGETPLQAVIREAKEELGLELEKGELEFQGKITGQLNDLHFQLHVFVWRFDGNLDALTMNEGAGMALVSPDEMLKRVEPTGPDYEITCLVRGILNGLHS